MPRMVGAFFVAIFALLTVFFEGVGQHISDSIFYQAIGDKRFYYFFTYFYVGYYASSSDIKFNNGLTLMAFAIGLFLYGYTENSLLIGMGKTVSNISLILFLLSMLKTFSCEQNCLAKIGKVSLPIYLWHVFPLLILKEFSLPEYGYYLLCLIVFSLLVFMFVRLEGQSDLLDKYLYGLDHEKAKTSR